MQSTTWRSKNKKRGERNKTRREKRVKGEEGEAILGSFKKKVKREKRVRGRRGGAILGSCKWRGRREAILGSLKNKKYFKQKTKYVPPVTSPLFHLLSLSP